MRLRELLGTVLLALIAPVTVVAQPSGPPPVETTLEDFFQPGTQPNTVTDQMLPGVTCTLCHADYNDAVAPYERWQSSMMAQAARDPIFYACLAIAEQDAEFVGDLCIRCHTPNGWLAGNSEPTDGSALNFFDFDGVTCNFCHRMVDPNPSPENPIEDGDILNALAEIPDDPHSGQYIIDPFDRRRGPFELLPGFGLHDWLLSPFHQESLLCATCHDVSNPAFVRDGDDYVLGELDEPHPTHDKYEQFPLERTFSEWSQSDFAQGPIDMMGRFGGNQQEVSSCQDCHMPDASGFACSFTGSSIFRTDLPLHDFYGGNTWVLRAVLNLDQTMVLYNQQSLLSIDQVEEAIAGNINFLELASDMELFQEQNTLRVRITNQTGHKLPTGYPEGRRMWINVRFLNSFGATVVEHGAYDFDTADLDTTTTKVYESKLGLDAELAAATGLPEGEGFHFAVNNKIFKDNRIPPRGFTNDGFESVQAAPVAYGYEDGQYWDDTEFPIPPGTTSAEVKFYYQTTSKEYIEFLLNENTTNAAGQIAYDQWEITGKSEPVAVDEATIDIVSFEFLRGDTNGDLILDLIDPLVLLGILFTDTGEIVCFDGSDGNDDGTVNITDPIYVLNFLFIGGPEPPAPFPNCGTDPTADGIGCFGFAGCP